MAMPSARTAPSTRQITFDSNTIAAGYIHQLVTCGAKAENFCGLGKTSLTTFSANGTATSIANLPEDANFAIANSTGTYVFSHIGNLYSLSDGAFILMNGFTTSGVKTAAISGNTIAALTSDGQLRLYDVANQITLGSYTVPPDSNNIAFTSDNYILVGTLGSKSLAVLDRSGNSNTYTLPASLLILDSSDSGEALASLSNGTVVAVDSYGNTTLRARANKAEDLHAGFRITGRTLVLAPAATNGVRHLTRLTVDVQK
jgi:WD40 repeat protein